MNLILSIKQEQNQITTRRIVVKKLLAMSTTDSEDPETEIHVVDKRNRVQSVPSPSEQLLDNEPAQIYSEMRHVTKEEEELDRIIDSEEDTIFPFIDLETAGNGQEDWEIFNILCGMSTNRSKSHVSGRGS